MARRKFSQVEPPAEPDYGGFVAELADLLEQSRRQAARAVNSVLTATYWEVGRRIVEFEQKGEIRAGYGKAVIPRLAQDLTAKFGRGFSERNLEQMRKFHLGWQICPTPSKAFEARAIFAIPGEKAQTLSAQFPLPIAHEFPTEPATLFGAFPLSWSHYPRPD